MDGEKYTRNVIILMIGVASIILGMLFANISHKLSNNKDVSSLEKTAEIEEAGSVDETVVESSEPELFETCVLISTDKDIVLNSSDLLEKHGYSVKINESQRANKLIFSLLIDKQIPKEDAILLGEEIKAKFQNIRSYWIEEVNNETESSHSEQEYVEVETVITDPKETQPVNENIKPELSSPIEQGERYEIQLMANTDYDKINTTKQFLEDEGYNLKIIEFEKDGVIYYRLRMKNAYSKIDANSLGEELKQKFKFINSYWLDKIIK